MSRVRAARYAAEAARLGIAAARAQIVFDTTVAYVDLMRAKRAVMETQANVDRLGRYVDTIDRLRRSGRAIENDALKVRTARDAAELALSRRPQRSASCFDGARIDDRRFHPRTTSISSISASFPRCRPAISPHPNDARRNA